MTFLKFDVGKDILRFEETYLEDISRDLGITDEFVLLGQGKVSRIAEIVINCPNRIFTASRSDLYNS